MKKKEIILSSGIRISYLDNENYNKKILLFVHGWGADKYNLHAVYNFLMKDHHIICPDLPGFGESTIPPSDSKSRDYSDYIFEFTTRLNLKNINYIGHSFGGKIGILLSVQYPEMIKRLILIDSSGLRANRNISWFIKVYAYKLLKNFYIRIIGSREKAENLKNKYGSEDYKKSGPMRSILINLVNEDFTEILPEISCPVFLYWGKKDKDTPLWMAKKMLKLIKDSALYTVNDGGHYSFLQDNKIISIIRSFAV